MLLKPAVLYLRSDILVLEPAFLLSVLVSCYWNLLFPDVFWFFATESCCFVIVLLHLLFCSCILAFCYWNLQTALLSFRFEILLLKTALLLLLCSEGVIHLSQTPSLICRILHILRKPNSIIAKYTYGTRSCRLFVCYLWDI